MNTLKKYALVCRNSMYTRYPNISGFTLWISPNKFLFVNEGYPNVKFLTSSLVILKRWSAIILGYSTGTIALVLVKRVRFLGLCQKGEKNSKRFEKLLHKGLKHVWPWVLAQSCHEWPQNDTSYSKVKTLYELSLANFNKSIKQSSNYVLQDFSLLY